MARVPIWLREGLYGSVQHAARVSERERDSRVLAMKRMRPRLWTLGDLACLKWSAILFGMLVGAYFSEFTKRFVWVLAVAMVLLAIKPVAAWFRKSP